MTCSPASGSTGAVSHHPPGSRPAGVPEPDSGAGTAFQGWPHASSLEFAGLPSAVPCGRLHTRQVLWEWRLGHLADDAELLVSEILSNAVKASWSPAGAGLIALRLLADDKRLVIEVWDHSPRDPQPLQPNAESENGRGFTVIEALSNRWGYRRVSASAKFVWAELLTESS